MWLVTCDNRSFTFIHSIICTLIFFSRVMVPFTIKERILEVARRNGMLLMTKKMEDLSNVIPLRLGLAKICFLKKNS